MLGFVDCNLERRSNLAAPDKICSPHIADRMFAKICSDMDFLADVNPGQDISKDLFP